MGWDDRKIKGPKAREGKLQDLGVGHSKKWGWKSPEKREKSPKLGSETPVPLGIQGWGCWGGIRDLLIRDFSFFMDVFCFSPIFSLIVPNIS